MSKKFEMMYLPLFIEGRKVERKEGFNLGCTCGHDGTRRLEYAQKRNRQRCDRRGFYFGTELNRRDDSSFPKIFDHS